MDVWDEVAARRIALADRVAALTPTELDADSWCDGWRVRDVLGHLVYLAEATRWTVTRDVLRRGPSPDRALARLARDLGDRPPEELTDRLRTAADGRYHVPGSPKVVVLGEILVHRADMLGSLGIDDPVEPHVAETVIGVYRRIGRLVFRSLPVSRVSLVATDTDLRLGSGPAVEGRAIDLLLLLANRRQVFDRLGGPGLSTLT